MYCDRLGRVRIRFHWQQETAATCWVRVAQRSAGGGMGSQFLPRIGQEVLVQFLENDIDRPDHRRRAVQRPGRGRTQADPGRHRRRAGDAGVFQPAHDHAVAGQGNLAGGNSPLWHGASGASAAHRNASAQWGVRSKEFGRRGAAGYNQLLFDDTDSQGRVQLKSSHAASELNLGHLIHGADNYRGSLRGAGAELRTDAYGAVRAGAGLLMTSYKLNHERRARDPAGDNARRHGAAQAGGQAGRDLQRGGRHAPDGGLAGHLGAGKPMPARSTTRRRRCRHSDASRAWWATTAWTPRRPTRREEHGSRATTSCRTASDADHRDCGQGRPGRDRRPETCSWPMAKPSSLMSGQDTQFISGGQMALHTGQAIGMLGGAVKAGRGRAGRAADRRPRHPSTCRRQADELKVQARDEVNVVSANAHVDWAAAKSISLSTAGGANITIEGGNITIQCPGKITVFAGKKSFIGPTRAPYVMPPLPSSTCKSCILSAMQQGAAGVLR